MENLKISVGMLGGRMYYGVPNILFKNNQLAFLYTDFVSNKFPFNILLFNETYRRKLQTRSVPFPINYVKQMSVVALRHYMQLRMFSKNPLNIHKQFYKIGQALEQKIIDNKFGKAQAILMIGSTCARVFLEAKMRGIVTIKEQISAPSAYTLQMMERAWSEFPDWGNANIEKQILKFWSEINYNDWYDSDYILCGSDFVVNAIEKIGGPASRCIVVPYGVPLPLSKLKNEKYTNIKPLRVLTVGAVGLRKGSPYILQAANQLNSLCEFRLIGSLPNSLPKMLQKIPANTQLLGHVNRTELEQHFQWAHVFLLPSLSEGSATVCYEALAYGLPLIVTPNAGQFFTDKLEGIYIEPFSSEAIIKALQYFIEYPDELYRMSENALQLAKQASFEAYEKRLLQAFQKIFKLKL